MQFWDEPCSNRPFRNRPFTMEVRIWTAAEMEYAALQCVIAPIGPGLQVDGEPQIQKSVARLVIWLAASEPNVKPGGRISAKSQDLPPGLTPSRIRMRDDCQPGLRSAALRI